MFFEFLSHASSNCHIAATCHKLARPQVNDSFLFNPACDVQDGMALAMQAVLLIATHFSSHGLCVTFMHAFELFDGFTPWAIKNMPLYFRPYLCQLLTDFQNSCTVTLCRQFAIMWLFYIPPHGKCVSTLPCKI